MYIITTFLIISSIVACYCNHRFPPQLSNVPFYIPKPPLRNRSRPPLPSNMQVRLVSHPHNVPGTLFSSFPHLNRLLIFFQVLFIQPSLHIDTVWKHSRHHHFDLRSDIFNGDSVNEITNPKELQTIEYYECRYQFPMT